MPSYNDTISIPRDLDLARPTEELRRAIYDAAYRLTFIEATEEPEELPGYGPEMCGFTVFHVFGRWFAVWYDLETDENHDLPPSVRWQLVRIHAAPERPEGIRFAGI